MTGTDVAVRRQGSAIPAKLAYAHELAESGLLPRHYQQRPANILWAMEYGEMLGLAPMAAITGVHVIEGKPTASAGLISALVRRAGHKLRISGDVKSATCQIVRADDPDYTFEVTFTIEDAKAAGLTGKDVWRKYAASMLKARAITQCARDACEEALFGLHYTPEEMGAEVDEDGAFVGEVVAEVVNVQPEASADQEWLNAALEAAPDHATLEACTVMWRRSAEKVHDQSITREDAGRLQAILRTRMETLKDQAEAGTVQLDSDDSWAAKLEELDTQEDAFALIAELSALLGAGELEEERFKQIAGAIEARFPQAGEGQAAA